MYRNSKVVAVTPAGRRKYMEVLAPYIFRDRHIFDQWMIWVNTGRDTDIAYLEGLQQAHPGFVRLIRYKEPITVPAPQPWFFRHACEKGTIYVKFDDDICWVDSNAVEELVKFRQDNPKPLVVLANTINNGYCAYIHSKRGAQDFFIGGEYPRIAPDCYNDVWRNPVFGEYVHKTFLNDLLAGETQKYLFESWPLAAFERFAINCIAWYGEDVNGEMGGMKDEELWLTVNRPRDAGRPNLICGSSLVSHFAFHKQRKPHCVGKELDERIHDAYKVLSYRLGDIAKTLYKISTLPQNEDKAVLAALSRKKLI
jgi:hypothetical protein